MFYGFWNWRYCFLLFALSAFAWLIAKLIMAKKLIPTPEWYLGVGISFFVLVLIYCKYTGFLLETFQSLMIWFDPNSTLSIIDNPILPLGISFITFHAISLLFDAYRQKLMQTPSLVNVLLYVSFFPQLIAGPILRASQFLPQLEKPRQADYIRITRAGILITMGLFKKVIIANYLATQLVDDVFSNTGEHVSTLLGVYGYAIQIYCDFSGYTDIAIGCAMLLGYQFPLNFRNPYIASSIQDFWHRWHITLSTWLRDYLYIPMGGSRYGLPRMLICLIVTMLIGGLWHGASWQFIIWGGYHGLLLVIYHLWAKWANNKNFSWRNSKLWKIFSIVFVFHLVTLGWIFFRATNMSDAFRVMNDIGQELISGTVFTYADSLAIIAILVGLGLQYIPIRVRAKIERFIGRRSAWIQGIMTAICIALIEYFGPIGVAPFIYFQF
jgi:D-alanyl-lipoteichoic acid acyltransferase DltB (MBOAT superfamily)